MTVPGSHLRHLVSQMTQRPGRAQDVSPLLPGTQFSDLPGFIEDLSDGLLACVPWKHHARSGQFDNVNGFN